MYRIYFKKSLKKKVIGIYPTNTNNIEKQFNCAHLASHPMKLATGDDDGNVKLYKFPCLEKDVKNVFYNFLDKI